PAVMGAKLDPEEGAHLAVEVGEASLRPAQHSYGHIRLTAEPLGEDTQGHRLTRAGCTGDQGKSTLAGKLLNAPAEGLDPRRNMQCFDGDVGGKRVPLEPIEGEMLLTHDASPSSSGRSSLGR